MSLHAVSSECLLVEEEGEVVPNSSECGAFEMILPLFVVEYLY